MIGKEKAARATGTAFKRNSKQTHSTTISEQAQGLIPPPGTFLCDQLRRYRNELAALPYSPGISCLVDCCTVLLEVGEGLSS